MKIYIRPHHLICLQGYKGFNYNRPQKLNWGKITEKLKSDPETDIVIISGSDDLCVNCSSKIKSRSSICNEENVKTLDQKVQDILGLTTGKTYKYGELLEILKEKIDYKIHKDFCSLCAWWKKGLCQDSFK